VLKYHQAVATRIRYWTLTFTSLSLIIGSLSGLTSLASGGSFEVLKSQKDFASRAVPHAQKIRPPIEVVVAHYWKK
jgi:hypothetical protein